MKSLTVLIFLSFFIPETNAQDSLYLIGTITGESYQKRITNVDRVGDVNGDGYDDFMIASRTGKIRKDMGIVQLFLGSATLDLTPDVTFHYPCCDTLNNLGNANAIGDVNGDGYDDFTISGYFGDFGFAKGKVLFYYGGETIDTIPVAEFYEPWIQDYFGEDVEAVGDLNQDGYDDFLICSSYNWSNARGYAYLFWGGDTISSQRSMTFVSGALEDFFGTSTANIGDINDDGFEDIAISATAWLGSNDTAKVYIYYGGEEMNNIADTILIANNGSDEIGKEIKRCGDVNNDGKVDFIIGSSGSWQAILLYVNIDSLISFDGYPYIGAYGDLNKDGFSDFIIGDPNYLSPNNFILGAAYVYLGKKNVDTNYTYILKGECGSEFSTIVFFADINGDDYDEIVLLAPSYPVFENSLGKVYIYSYKKLTDVKDNQDNFLNNFELQQNYPNPFNPSTKIKYTIPTPPSSSPLAKGRNEVGFVTLIVYDVLGKEVATLVSEEKPAGSYEVEFNSVETLHATSLPSGVYFYQLRAGDYNETKKMILLK
jgi:hypothetical protein